MATILLSVLGTMFILLIGFFGSMMGDASISAGGKCAFCCGVWCLTAAAGCFYFAWIFHA